MREDNGGWKWPKYIACAWNCQQIISYPLVNPNNVLLSPPMRRNTQLSQRVNLNISMFANILFIACLPLLRYRSAPNLPDSTFLVPSMCMCRVAKELLEEGFRPRRCESGHALASCFTSYLVSKLPFGSVFHTFKPLPYWSHCLKWLPHLVPKFSIPPARDCDRQTE